MTVAREKLFAFDQTRQIGEAQPLHVKPRVEPNVVDKQILDNASEITIDEASPVYLDLSHFQNYCRILNTRPGVYKDVDAISHVYWCLWSGAQAAGRIADLEECNLIPDQLDYAQHEAWQLGGLQMSSDYCQLDVHSLVNSVENGSIFALIGENDAHKKALLHFLGSYGIMAEPDSKRLEYDPALLPNTLALAEGNSHRDFFDAAFAETRGQPYAGKNIVGPLKDQFGEHIAQIKRRLAAIDSSLPLEVLQPDFYQDPGIKKLLRSLDLRQQRRIWDLSYDLSAGHNLLAINLWSLQQDDIIGPGTLDQPRYLRQKDSTRCANAALRMLFQGITGEAVSESAVDPERYWLKYRHDREYLNIFHSQRFREQYGMSVQTICFSGMTLETLGKLAGKIKAADSARKVFVVTALETETAEDKRIQHRSVLLGAEGDEVILHDPAPGVGEAARRIAKQEFCRRWAATQNSGYMVIAAPK